MNEPKIRTNEFNVKEFFTGHPGKDISVRELRKAGFSKRVYGICKSLVSEEWLEITADKKTGKNHYQLPGKLAVKLAGSDKGTRITGIDFHSVTIEMRRLIQEDNQLFLMVIPEKWQLITAFRNRYSDTESFPARLVLSDIRNGGKLRVFWIILPPGHLAVHVDGKKRRVHQEEEVQFENVRCVYQIAGKKGFAIEIPPSKRYLVFRPVVIQSDGTNGFLTCGVGHVNTSNWKKDDITPDVVISSATRVDLFSRERRQKYGWW